MRGEPEGVRKKQDGESYVEYYLDHREVEKSTERDYHKSWRRLETTLDELGYSIKQLGRSEVGDICRHWDRDDSVSDSRLDTDVNNISRLIEWLVTETGHADYNPFKHYTRYFKNKETNSTEKIEIPLDELRKFLLKIKTHRIEVFVFTFLLLKQGIRHSEALNLDLRDINLNHPISKKMPEPRKEVYNHPDSLYIDSTISEGEVHNGEQRAHGNKPRSSRQIPIDNECKTVLAWWIQMCPPSVSPANPLLRQLNDPEHRRPTNGFTKPHITKLAREEEFNGPNMTHFGFDAHWCRHWFTTQLRTNIDYHEVPVGSPKEYVQGLRGDTGSDVIETYTHDWGVEKKDQSSYREVYENNIPNLLIAAENQ